jgi:hypothetical protein
VSVNIGALLVTALPIARAPDNGQGSPRALG